MSVLVLHTEIMPYGVAILRELSNLLGCRITVIRKDKDRIRGYIPDSCDQIRFHGRSEFNTESLSKLYSETEPSLVYVSGWGDSEYLSTALLGRSAGIPVVTGLDNQWRGDVRQKLACLLSHFRVRRYFSHIQVAGVRQYEFARRLGYSPDVILKDLYSCDLPLFLNRSSNAVEMKRFLFVGRFAKVKGLRDLYEAWKQVAATNSDWQLHLIGAGPDLPNFSSLPNVQVSGYMTPIELADEVSNGGVFVLPSCKEPWGVVVHEYAASGLPLILSDACGAGDTFLINGYNGYLFRTGDSNSLAGAMQSMIELSESERAAMGARSAQLSTRISPEISAASLASLVVQR